MSLLHRYIYVFQEIKPTVYTFNFDIRNSPYSVRFDGKHGVRHPFTVHIRGCGNDYMIPTHYYVTFTDKSPEGVTKENMNVLPKTIKNAKWGYKYIPTKVKKIYKDGTLYSFKIDISKYI